MGSIRLVLSKKQEMNKIGFVFVVLMQCATSLGLYSQSLQCISCVATLLYSNDVDISICFFGRVIPVLSAAEAVDDALTGRSKSAFILPTRSYRYFARHEYYY